MKMNKYTSPYKEMGTSASKILGTDNLQEKNKCRHGNSKKNCVICHQQAPGAIGEKTGGHW